MDRTDDRTSAALVDGFGVPPDAHAIWRVLLANPDTDRAELTRLTALSAERVTAAISSLVEAQLVRESATPAGVSAIDPALAIETHIARAERQIAEQVERFAALRAVIPELANDYARGRAADGAQPGVEVVVSLEDIRRLIYLASESCRYEALNLHHATTAAALRHGQTSDTQMISHGVRCRAIVGATELSNPELYLELQEAHARGEVFRTLPEVPTRMLIFDRSLAVVAVDPTDIRHGAMFLRVRSLIDLLALLFDQMWAVADAVFTSATDSLAPTGRRARTLELMAIGTKDERIARTLGVAARTVRRDIADLKTTLGVSSRAEIVAAAVRKGWL